MLQQPATKRNNRPYEHHVLKEINRGQPLCSMRAGGKCRWHGDDEQDNGGKTQLHLLSDSQGP
eukprot:UN3069